MGRYTELIFGASLKKSTPNKVIETLKYMVNPDREKPQDFPFAEDNFDSLLRSGSSYFVIGGECSFWKDRMKDQWVLSSRSNIKNYHDEIETFLDWLKPYIEKGSGVRQMYAIVINEDSPAPDIYYLYDEDEY